MAATLPEFIPQIGDDIRKEIDHEIVQIEQDNDVKILFAIESGSRAWGFPSPDSDYDVRFVYVREVDWYLSIKPGRDVIERPISDELDISGWDIKKALGLILKSNAVAYEWLSSPIKYRWEASICNDLIDFSEKTLRMSSGFHHYLNLGRKHFETQIADLEHVRLKKYFYALRPALALKWLRAYPGDVPPMNLQQLVNGLEIKPQIVEIISDLIVRKANLDEAELIAPISELDEFITDEYAIADAAEKPRERPNFNDEADQLFRNIVHQLNK